MTPASWQRWIVAALATGSLACTHLDGESPPQAEAGCADNPSATLSVAIDSNVGSVQTSTGWLVPLEVVLTNPCFEGVAHATLLSSAGQFSSTGAVTDAGKAGSEGGGGASDGGTEGGGGPSGGSPDSGSAGGANTTLTLTPDGHGGLVGFATLSLTSAFPTARVQAVAGDWSACETLTTSPALSMTNAGVCSP